MGYKRSISDFKSIDLKQMRPKGFLERVNCSIKEKVKKVKQKHGMKTVEKCPVCSSKEFHVEFSKFDIDIVCCDFCSLRYSKKIPVNAEDIYSDSEYLPSSINVYIKNAAFRKERFAKERIELISKYIQPLNGKRLLDIGCGTGWFLEVAREYGFEIFGQELGKELADWSSDRLGIRIFKGPISDIQISNTFDVITMFDLLEHVENPLQLIFDCKRILNDKGIILVFTPNFDSLAIDVMKEHSNLISPVGHLTYFSEKSVTFLSQNSGMNLIYFKTKGIDLGDVKSYYEYIGECELERACEKLYDTLQPLVDESGAGNHLRFILSK